jgi:hypothetical protein
MEQEPQPFVKETFHQAVSDCCGSTISLESNCCPVYFKCENCGKKCSIKQFHDVKIELI